MSEVYERRDVEQLRKTADAFNCELVKARPNELLLDLDGGDDTFLKHAPVLNEIHGIVHITAWKSRNGRWHKLVVLSRAISPAERVAWQLLLGSDPIRERGLLMDLVLPLGAAGQTNVLFKPKT